MATARRAQDHRAPLQRLPLRGGARALQAADATVRDNLAWLDRLLAEKSFIVGDRFTVADIILYCAVDFGGTVGQPLDPQLANVGAWHARVAARPSASASLHPQSAAVGMRG